MRGTCPFRGAGGKVGNRRDSSVAAHSGDRLLAEPTAGTQPWRREPLFMPEASLNPQSVEAQTWLADVLSLHTLRQRTDRAAADIARAKELVEQALAASPRSPHAHYDKAQILRATGRCKEAIPEYETVISSDPNFASAYANLGWCKFRTGSIEDMIPLEERALRFMPRGPFVGTLYSRIGTAHSLQSNYEDAIRWFEKARNTTLWPAEVVGHKAAIDRAVPLPARLHADRRQKLAGPGKGDSSALARRRGRRQRPDTNAPRPARA